MQKRINLKLLRVAHDYTQKQMAELLDIDISYYNQIEANKRAGSQRVWDKIADIFDLTIPELYSIRYNELI